MNKTKHTRGPWHWSNHYRDSRDDITWSLVDSTGYGILSCDGVCNSPQGFGDHENAALIAAAPDMYEALKIALDETDGTPAYDFVLAAIAKAEGRL